MRPILLAILLLFAPAAGAERFTFVAFGDMPYCDERAMESCPAEEVRVARLMAAINAARPAFSIFLGDTKGGDEHCTDTRLLRALDWMALADHPLVYTPGDNEWTDCWQDRAGRFDPQERLALLRRYFFARAESLGQVGMRLLRQADIDPVHRAFVENARWSRQGVVFVTVHVTGSNNNRPTEPGETPASRPPEGAMAEYTARNAANLAWLEAGFAEAVRTQARAVVIALQANMYFAEDCPPRAPGQRSGFVDTVAALERLARSFGRPVLLLQGDSHFFVHRRGQSGIPNLSRVMVPGARDVRAVRVQVDTDAPDPWRFSPIGTDDRPGRTRC